jgi:8-oxo-dGTP diphosphatase
MCSVITLRRVPVVVGVLEGPAGYLISQRRADQSYPGYWEFPGGKVEVGESLAIALARELREELGIEVLETAPLRYTERTLEDRIVELHVYRVLRYTGTPSGCEGQTLRWADLTTLSTLTFPSSNAVIIADLQAAAMKKPVQCKLPE